MENRKATAIKRIEKILKKHQNEIEMVKRNPKEHSSAFYIIQKL